MASLRELPGWLRKATKEHTKYLRALVPGDTVYPCYDGKICRATPCCLIEKRAKSMLVEGVLWGQDHPQKMQAWFNGKGEAFIQYTPGKPTLMQQLGVSGKGDFYVLVDLEPYYQSLAAKNIRQKQAADQ